MIKDTISFRIDLFLYSSSSFCVKDAITLRVGDKNEVISTLNPKYVQVIDATCSSLSVACNRGAGCCHHAKFTDGNVELLLSMTSITRIEGRKGK
jgi:hypothetical protein